MRNWPCASVTPSNVLPVSSWMMVMVTPGSTPPDESVTVPVIVACCAKADTAKRSRIAAANTNRERRAFISPPVDGFRGTAAEYDGGRLEPAPRCVKPPCRAYNLRHLDV